MVSLITWNINGISNGPSLRRIKKIIKIHQVSVIALLEPMISAEAILELKTKLQCQGCLANSTSKIWLLWKEGIHCYLLNDHEQHLTVEASYVKCDHRVR